MKSIKLVYINKQAEFLSVQYTTIRTIKNNMQVMKAGEFELEYVVHEDPKICNKIWKIWESLKNEK